ncbi:MAG: dihydrolipoyllysine-residue acetyltransferase [Burkholderiales bacterium]|nr:dihydrolipoyllysine-residue acetyltransferase [Burkholderiales bacterium]
MATLSEVRVPDIGDFKDIPVIEVLIKPGDEIAVEDSLITLESDKATMDVPSPSAGRIAEVKVKVGDKVSEGTLVATIEAASSPATEEKASAQAAAKVKTATGEPDTKDAPAGSSSRKVEPAIAQQQTQPEASPPDQSIDEVGFAQAHASPSVRRFARELGVDLGKVRGSGPKERILKEDVQAYVKSSLAASAAAAPGFGVPAMPAIDFAKFGPIETRELSRIKKLSGANLHRNWLAIPHVTQHDEADITELDEFRKTAALESEKQGVRLTLLAFFLKASAVALKQYPDFNASLNTAGDKLVLKHYFHIGVAVDTPDGLLVPVIRDVDKKGVFDLARELAEVSKAARDKKLPATAMQGGSFSISSLGGIGGTAFTPIINAPEVAILGLSKSSLKPVFVDGKFQPRLILPLSLSYDHRVIDGASAARFTTFVSSVLSDIRRLLL